VMAKSSRYTGDPGRFLPFVPMAKNWICQTSATTPMISKRARFAAKPRLAFDTTSNLPQRVGLAQVGPGQPIAS